MRPRPPKGLPMLKKQDGSLAHAKHEMQEEFARHFSSLHVAVGASHEQLVRDTRATDEEYWTDIADDIVSICRRRQMLQPWRGQREEEELLVRTGRLHICSSMLDLSFWQGSGRSSSRLFYIATSRCSGEGGSCVLFGSTRALCRRPRRTEPFGSQTRLRNCITGGWCDIWRYS